MSIIKEKCGEMDGREVCLFTLDNGRGLSAEILNYGGIITRLVFNGVDVICGRDSFEEYRDNSVYFGAIIGRNSNRIENAVFELNGKSYKLFKNNGDNNHHGGDVGFDKKLWDAEMVDAEEPSLVLSLVSPDGDEGFPGEFKVRVSYTLTKDNELSIHYEGISDADTIANMTSHGYFNLNGHDSGLIDGHRVWINSDFYAPNKDSGVPTGEILTVTDTPFDLRDGALLGERFSSDNREIKHFNGFDHSFAIKDYGYRMASKATGDRTGISMEVYTDCSAVHFYTSNSVEEGRVCKDGTVYAPHEAFCFETQCFPNAVNVSHFPNGFLKKGEKYDSKTSYRFFV